MHARRASLRGSRSGPTYCPTIPWHGPFGPWRTLPALAAQSPERSWWAVAGARIGAHACGHQSASLPACTWVQVLVGPPQSDAQRLLSTRCARAVGRRVPLRVESPLLLETAGATLTQLRPRRSTPRSRRSCRRRRPRRGPPIRHACSRSRCGRHLRRRRRRRRRSGTRRAPPTRRA